MEYKPLPIGIDNFETLITKGYYYVDKTLLIKELLDKKGAVTLFTRPRRFGKTLNISMLQYFFEDFRKEDGTKIDHTHLFEGLDIMQAGEKYCSYMGQYPVISLSLKSGKQPNFQLAYDMLVRQIAYEYQRHSFILQDERLADEKTNEHYLELAIPNKEVKYIFRTKILSWFQEKIEEKDLSVLYTALINKDVKVFEDELNDILMETISFNDAYENFYHGFVTGVLSGMKNYRVKSNREGGTGRSDLFIKPPTRRKAAFVIEFKIADKFEQLEKKADEALQQIADRRYVDELKNDGFQTVIQYGIAFFRKDCMVKIKE